jgi:hypothetical protein
VVYLTLDKLRLWMMGKSHDTFRAEIEGATS